MWHSTAILWGTVTWYLEVTRAIDLPPLMSRCPGGSIPRGRELTSVPVTFRNAHASPNGLQTDEVYECTDPYVTIPIMRVVDSEHGITKGELKGMAESMFGDLVKAVVDIRQEIMVVDAELHADQEALLLERGSNQADLWGINLYPDLSEDQFVEFDSMINLRPSQDNRSRGVEDTSIRERILAIVDRLVFP